MGLDLPLLLDLLRQRLQVRESGSEERCHERKWHAGRRGLSAHQCVAAIAISDEELGLLRAASDVGCALSLSSLDGSAVVGDAPPQTVLDALKSGARSLAQAMDGNIWARCCFTTGCARLRRLFAAFCK